MTLRPVSSTEQPESPIASQIRAAAEAAIAAGAVTFFCAWEVSGKYDDRCVPNSTALRDGYSRMILHTNQWATDDE